MAQTFLFNEQLHFAHEGRNYCVAAYGTVGTNFGLFAQVGNSHTFEFLRGLYSTGGDTASLGDIGTFLVGKFPAWEPIINAALESKPNYAPIPNAPAANLTIVARAMWQYIKAESVDGKIKLSQKPYP